MLLCPVLNSLFALEDLHFLTINNNKHEILNVPACVSVCVCVCGGKPWAKYDVLNSSLVIS